MDDNFPGGFLAGKGLHRGGSGDWPATNAPKVLTETAGLFVFEFIATL